jgi:hypothetical protein
MKNGNTILSATTATTKTQPNEGSKTTDNQQHSEEKEYHTDQEWINAMRKKGMFKLKKRGEPGYVKHQAWIRNACADGKFELLQAAGMFKQQDTEQSTTNSTTNTSSAIAAASEAKNNIA